MDSTTWIMTFVALGLAAGGGVFYYRRRSIQVQQFFEQIMVTAKQVPHQKKSGFILLMLKESILASKSKKAAAPRKMNDPRQLEAQMIQMSSILKDRSRVSDKNMKRALQTYDSYLAWEKKQISKTNRTA